MSGMSAANAKKTAKVGRPRQQVVDTVYTINGKKCTLSQVMDLVYKTDPTSVVTRKKVRARLDMGHRDLKALAADKLPHYRPLGMKGKRS